MRPTKLTPKVVQAFETVLKDDMYVRVCTDIELCHLINNQLEEHEEISYRSFQRYKLLVKEHTYAATHKERMKEEYDIYRKLYKLWMDARIRQKVQLMKFIEGKVAGWQRYRWILERKFTEFAQKPIKTNESSGDFMPTFKDDAALRAALRNSVI